ncbi:MAG: hypothetical protein AB7E80_07895 [Hyphomicrobiaceae bacterium]
MLAAAGVIASVGGAAGPAAAEPAIGQFELKGLEAEPGRVEFQSQNAFVMGNPRRRFAPDAPGEFVYDENEVQRLRHALEIEMSLTRFWRMRVGIEFEKERLDDPPAPALANAFDDLKLTEVALESVIILKPVSENGIGFGLLTEFEHPFGSAGLNSIVFGPIIGARSGAWTALLNLTLVHFFGAGEITPDGLEKDNKWDLAYAAQLKHDFSESWALALEAYGTFDRLGSTGRPGEGALAFGDHDQHRAGPVLYYAWRSAAAGGGEVRGLDGDDGKATGDGDDGGVEVTLGTGLLFGFNDNTPAATLKLSLEVEF